jgi:hypothetical protein
VALGTSGFAVLRAEEWVVPSAAELEADPTQYADSSLIETAYADWRATALGSVDVAVSPTVGSWSDNGGILPPGG